MAVAGVEAQATIEPDRRERNSRRSTDDMCCFRVRSLLAGWKLSAVGATDIKGEKNGYRSSPQKDAWCVE